VPVFCWMP